MHVRWQEPNICTLLLWGLQIAMAYLRISCDPHIAKTKESFIYSACIGLSGKLDHIPKINRAWLLAQRAHNRLCLSLSFSSDVCCMWERLLCNAFISLRRSNLCIHAHRVSDCETESLDLTFMLSIAHSALIIKENQCTCHVICISSRRFPYGGAAHEYHTAK